MFNVNNDTYKRITSRDIRNVFLLGGLAGMLVFIACYGVSILDVTNDAWLLSGEDITQHYIGWSSIGLRNGPFRLARFRESCIRRPLVLYIRIPIRCWLFSLSFFRRCSRRHSSILESAVC